MHLWAAHLHFQWTFSLGRRRNHARPGQRKFSCPGRESNSRPSKSHHSRETNKKIMAGILSYEPAFDRKIAENFGYVSSVQEAYKLIAEFETRSTTKFSCFKVDKDFGNFGVYPLLRFSQTCQFWSSKANWRLRFSLPSIILTDLLGNKTLL